MPGPEPGPLTWLVLGDKGGDNAQVETIAQALPWPYERRFVAMRPRYVKGKPRVRPSLHHLDLAASDALEAPWPELVITVGRRPSLVALWIKQQSGGRTRIVFIGKPSARVDRFDLVIASSEVLLPDLPNVLMLSLPLMRLDAERVNDAVGAWQSEFAGLARPLVGFLIGGPTNPFRYNREMARRLAAEATRVVNVLGGTPYLTTSRRTPERFMRLVEAALPPQALVFRWSPSAEENPYSALLGSADALVVAGDSISMAVEVARLGQPLAILMPGYGPVGRMDRWRRRVTRWLLVEHPTWGRRLYRARLINQTRDYDVFYQNMIAAGRAVWAGGSLPTTRHEPAKVEVDRVIDRIRALFSLSRSPEEPASLPGS